MTALEMVYRMKQLRVVAECAGDRAQAADMLGMSPSRVVTPTIAM
jgi:Bacterial regulatory protein, Fis family.